MRVNFMSGLRKEERLMSFNEGEHGKENRDIKLRVRKEKKRGL